MPIVVNATQEKVTVKVVGNYFTFNPGQSKTIREDIAKFIQMDIRGCGLAVLPDLLQEGEEALDISDADMAARREEQRALKETLCAQALNDYIKRLRDVIYNNQVSMRQDLEKQNIKADPSSFASDGELEAMRIVARYQQKSKDEDNNKIREVNKLMEQVKMVK